MTAKLIVSILFLLLILEILPKRSEAIANGPGQACKGNSELCWKTGLMEDDKVHTYNTIHVLGLCLSLSIAVVLGYVNKRLIKVQFLGYVNFFFPQVFLLGNRAKFSRFTNRSIRYYFCFNGRYFPPSVITHLLINSSVE